jgi:predicted small secreted protein
MRKFLLMPALLGALALTTTACEVNKSISIGKTVSAAKVEEQIVAKFSQPFDDGGIGPATAECPEDLKGEVGVTIECTVRDGNGRDYPLIVTVTAVEGDQVRFNMKEPPQPKGAE